MSKHLKKSGLWSAKYENTEAMPNGGKQDNYNHLSNLAAYGSYKHKPCFLKRYTKDTNAICLVEYHATIILV
jgi:hypothetical protein